MTNESLVPEKKLSKKARKARNAQRRADWNGVKPVTRVIPDKRRKLQDEQQRREPAED